MSKPLPNIHPGRILEQEFLKPLKLSRYRLAKNTGLSPTRIGEIVRGKRAITAETALRLGRFFGTSARFWMNLQAEYDLRQAEKAFGRRLEREVLALKPVA